MKIVNLILSATVFFGWGHYSIAQGTVKSLRPVTGNVQVPETKFSDGKKLVTLDSFRGRGVVLNFWATWCGPCVVEMPSLDRLSAKLDIKKFVVVAVSQDNGGPSQVKPFLEKLKIKNLTILYDPSQGGLRDFGIRGLPTTVVVSSKGQVLARLEGSVEWDSVEMISKIKALNATHK
jgi:thiol-disulfide isomerase/thioredoxin